MSKFKRQIPNLLTLVRIPLALLCAYFAFTLKTAPLTISLALFLVASATDYLDGYLARKWKLVSNFGKILDPIADKLLILSVLLIFTYHGEIPVIWTVLIFIREIGLTIIRLILVTKKVVLASRFSGKMKTVFQIGLILTLYTVMIFKPELRELIGQAAIKTVILVLTIWTVAITLYSGYEFIKVNRKAIEKLV